MLTPALVGIVLALAVSGYAMAIGLDRDRAFYPTVLVVVASYYVLFAVMAGAGRATIIEACIASAFLLIAAIGFKRNPWFVVAALATHGLLDLVHGSVVSNPGVPAWWPSFCLTYDVTAAALLALTLRFRLPVKAE
jgi:hypothetical protein